jgi:tRNA threonylcarbamoyladenosine biosynthesis protein TsaE
MSKTFKYLSLSELPYIASQIIEFGESYNIWLFEGQMGAGKTTLIKEICKQFGVEESVNSPTYSLVNEYATKAKKIIFHFDFYRLKNETEALDYGLEEYFDSGNLCLCEWPSMIPNLWPNQYLMLNLNILDDGSREIIIKKIIN